jgi:hypothetical protein
MLINNNCDGCKEGGGCYKYILTFDIGIKNLAYCLVRYPINAIMNFDILYWGIIDISNENDKKCLKCNSKSYYCCKETKNNYCKKHGANIKEKIKIKNNDSFNLQIERLIKALSTFYTNMIDKPYSLNACITNGNDKLETNGTSDIILSNNIVNNLMIYIENQPVLKNPIMKTISICLYTFFNIKKLQYPNKIKSINFISATIKTRLPFYNFITNNYTVTTKMNKLNDYKNRKIFCIDIVAEIITQLNQSYYNIIANCYYSLSKKKDDLADTLLYILYALPPPTAPTAPPNPTPPTLYNV